MLILGIFYDPKPLASLIYHPFFCARSMMLFRFQCRGGFGISMLVTYVKRETTQAITLGWSERRETFHAVPEDKQIFRLICLSPAVLS
jgi:hypothetical protein